MSAMVDLGAVCFCQLRVFVDVVEDDEERPSFLQQGVV